MRKPLRPIARRALAAQSDARLVRLIREGHEPAFEEVVRRYRQPLTAFAAAIASASRAEDVVQAALHRAHRALLDDDREVALRSWLFAIVRNGALNSIRDEPRWSELDAEQDVAEQQPPAIVEQREEVERLIVAICALPEAQRKALVMREMEGAGHGDIAAQLHTSPTAVRGLIFRARTTLRNSLGAALPLPVLRWLLDEGLVAGGSVAAGGAGGGTLLGGLLGKGAIGVTTAVIAVGAGTAIRDRDSGGSGPGSGGVSKAHADTQKPRSSSAGVVPGARAEKRYEGREESRDRAEERREAHGDEESERREERREDRGEGDEERRERHEDGGDDRREHDDDSEGLTAAGDSDDDRYEDDERDAIEVEREDEEEREDSGDSDDEDGGGDERDDD